MRRHFLSFLRSRQLMRRHFFICMLLLAMLIFSLPCLSSAADLNLERELSGNLARGRAIIMKMEEKLGTGDSISLEMSQLKALAEDIRAIHLQLKKRFKLRQERIKVMGTKAEDRHRRMSQNYSKTLDEFLTTIKDLLAEGAGLPAILERLKSLLDEMKNL